MNAQDKKMVSQDSSEVISTNLLITKGEEIIVNKQIDKNLLPINAFNIFNAGIDMIPNKNDIFIMYNLNIIFLRFFS